MKKVKIFVIIISVLSAALAGTAIGLSIWANKPRGIRINLDFLPEEQ